MPRQVSEKKPVKKVVVKDAEEEIIKPKPVEKKTKVVEPVAPEKKTKVVETPETTESPAPEKKERKPRKVVTSDIVNDNLDKIIENATLIEDKKMRSILKELKSLKNDLKKVMKKKVGERKRDVVNSGFFKEVKITDDLAKFMSCNPSDLKSRVDVTRFICKYVKDKNLQNQADKRYIIPDDSLQKLLKYNPNVDGQLSFPSVQKLIQKHFVKSVAA